MEVRVNAQGEVIINTNGSDANDVLEFIEAMQSKVRRKQKAEERAQTTRESFEEIPVGTGKLNRIQYRTWEFLCENDCPDGTHVSQVGKAFGISTPAANTRLIVLVKMGYAKRVHRGYYRALTPAE